MLLWGSFLHLLICTTRPFISTKTSKSKKKTKKTYKAWLQGLHSVATATGTNKLTVATHSLMCFSRFPPRPGKEQQVGFRCIKIEIWRHLSGGPPPSFSNLKTFNKFLRSRASFVSVRAPDQRKGSSRLTERWILSLTIDRQLETWIMLTFQHLFNLHSTFYS